MWENRKILVKGKVLSMKEFFQEAEKSGRRFSKMKFEEKIRVLVELQKFAKKWNKRKDIIVWRLYE